MPAPGVIALRMDDVGASSKRYEVYARPVPLPGRLSLVGNVGMLKYLPPLRAWGPYRELTAAEWERILEALARHGAKLTVAVTAAWVTANSEIVPFPERFPAQANVIRQGVREERLEVANHGLTHCVVEDRAFLPRSMRGNRRYHREFWEWVPERIQREHLARAQSILEGWIGERVVTFVPPGNVFTQVTVAAARDVGLRVLSCATTSGMREGVTILSDSAGVHAFHDRDLVLKGVHWLERLLERETRTARTCFVRELAGVTT